VLPAFDVLKRIAATVRGGSKPRRGGERGSGRGDHRHPSLGRSIIWARNLLCSRPRREAAALGTALCKTPPSLEESRNQGPKPGSRAGAMLWTSTELGCWPFCEL